jgi:hypothetical protein
MGDDPFVWAGPNSAKVKCVVCGRSGWGPRNAREGKFSPWQLSCLDGHPLSCTCGHRFSTGQGLASHIRLARTGSHARSES